MCGRPSAGEEAALQSVGCALRGGESKRHRIVPDSRIAREHRQELRELTQKFSGREMDRAEGSDRFDRERAPRSRQDERRDIHDVAAGGERLQRP